MIKIPLLSPLLELLQNSLDQPLPDSVLYHLFLARALMLSHELGAQEIFARHVLTINECVKRADRHAWLSMPAEALKKMIVAWENTFYV